MTIAVNGATGPFGRHAVETLLRRGVPADQIVAIGRRIEKIEDLGVRAERADYRNPEELRAAFEGVERILFVSGREACRRIPQHRNGSDAAKAVRAGLVAYTSIVRADTSDLMLAAEHRETERMIRDSGVLYVFLRNSWYLENYDFRTAADHGLVGAAGGGRISAALRADYAEAAAAAVLAGEANRVYELGGPGFTLAELAAEIGRVAGRDVAYTDLSPEAYAEYLVGVGLPEAAAAGVADGDRGAAQGALEVTGDDLETLLGRPATPLADVIRAALG